MKPHFNWIFHSPSCLQPTLSSAFIVLNRFFEAAIISIFGLASNPGTDVDQIS